MPRETSPECWPTDRRSCWDSGNQHEVMLVKVMQRKSLEGDATAVCKGENDPLVRLTEVEMVVVHSPGSGFAEGHDIAGFEVGDDVVPTSRLEDELILTRTPLEDVIPGAAIKLVLARAAVQLIVAAASFEPVTAAQSVDGLAAFGPD